MQTVYLPTQESAEQVLEELKKLIEKGGYAAVSDLYNLTDIPARYSDTIVGWNMLHNVKVVETEHGFILGDLPAPTSIFPRL